MRRSCTVVLRKPCLLATLTGFALGFSLGGVVGAVANSDLEKLLSATNVFEASVRLSLQRRLTASVIELFRDRRYAEAETTLRNLVDRYPNWPVHHYNLAAALARQDKRKEALERLHIAISQGFLNKIALQRDPDLDNLRDLPRFEKLLAGLEQNSNAEPAKQRAPIKPLAVENQRALVHAANTAWEPRTNTLVTAFKFSNTPNSDRVRGPDDPVSSLLNQWYRAGDAAGNHGDLYDNRDNGHSRLERKLFPQISHVEYSGATRAAGVHYGVNSRFLFNSITFGNSSTALTGQLWRSQARHVMTTPHLIARSYQHDINNHLYVFPEHIDHDPEKGDLFPANTPYFIVSQGSSGSDRPMLRAVASILAAFRPETKAFLRTNHLVVPTVQMIFRSSLKSVSTAGDYLSAKAHPSAFDGADLDVEKMVRRAHELRANAVPPRVHIAVVEESVPRSGIDYFGPADTNDKLFDTPGAIARVIRSTALEKRMVISAEKTKDPNGLPLEFVWKVLRGDADRIMIRTINDNGAVVALRIPWHRSMPVPFNPALSTHRVDIAVFAHNGANYSAPAFVSFFYPPNQVRRYSRDGRLIEIAYDPPERQDRYADPVLFVRRGWRDRYHYTREGRLIGWDRVSGNAIQKFTRHGARVVETDAFGRATKAERMRYEIKVAQSGLRRIVPVPSGEFIEYRYSAETDLVGER